MAEEKKRTIKIKKNKKKHIPKGKAYIQATYNNTIITVTDLAGNTVAWSSAGQVGFKGPKKATPYAASIIVKNVVEKINNVNMRSLNIYIKGVGAGREAAIRAFNANNINVLSIKDITPIPHNGCRPPKIRRV